MATTDHRRQHSPEYQAGAHVHPARPACWSDRREPRAGAPFHTGGAVCGCALTAETWASLLSSTPACHDCARGRREEMPGGDRLTLYAAWVMAVCLGLPALAAWVLA